MVSVISVDHPPQPFTDPPHRFVHPCSQRLPDSVQLRPYSFARRVAPDGEDAVPGFPAIMRETQKGECFRFSLTPPLTIPFGESAEFNQPRFLRMQFQTELAQPFPELPAKPLGVRPVLESHDEIIGVPNSDYVTVGHLVPPCLYPQVEYVMQVDVCQQRRNVSPNA